MAQKECLLLKLGYELSLKSKNCSLTKHPLQIISGDRKSPLEQTAKNRTNEATISMLLTAKTELGLNARQVASKRYSNKDQQGQPLEDWEAIVNRVVTHVSAAEHDANERKAFYRDMT